MALLIRLQGAAEDIGKTSRRQINDFTLLPITSLRLNIEYSKIISADNEESRLKLLHNIPISFSPKSDFCNGSVGHDDLFSARAANKTSVEGKRCTTTPCNA